MTGLIACGLQAEINHSDLDNGHTSKETDIEYARRITPVFVDLIKAQRDKGDKSAGLDMQELHMLTALLNQQMAWKKEVQNTSK